MIGKPSIIRSPTIIRAVVIDSIELLTKPILVLEQRDLFISVHIPVDAALTQSS